MTRGAVKAWLAAREPAPPADLAARLAQCVDEAPDATYGSESLSEVIGVLGTWLLDTVIQGQKAAYHTALDLLAADAFVTYAFEAASEEDADVTDLASRLLTQVRA